MLFSALSAAPASVLSHPAIVTIQSIVHNVTADPSFTKIRFPEIAGCAHVALSDTL